MVLETRRASSGTVRGGDVIVHEPVVLADVPRMLALCWRSALGAGLSRFQALRVVITIGQGLLRAIRHGGGRPVFTLVRDGTVCLTAQVVAQRTALPALELEYWRELSTARHVDGMTVRSSRRAPTPRAAMAIHSYGRAGQPARWPLPNQGHFNR